MVADYRYVFSTLRAEQVVQEIDLFGVYFSLALNGGSSQFDGTFQLNQTGKRNSDLIAATEPGRTFVVIERNGVPVAGYIIWSRVYSAQDRTVQLHGTPFEAYPNVQRITTEESYSNVEQVEIFKQLWRNMMAAYGRNINVIIDPTVAPTINPKTIDILPSEVKYYGEAMSSLADSSNGFDWYIAFTKSGNYYQKNLRIGYPKIGTPSNPNMPVFEYPGNITQYYFTESMAGSGTNIFVVGAGSGPDLLISEVDFPNLINYGMPRWDIDISRKDVTTQALLNTVAAGLAPTLQSPITTFKMTVKADKVPEWGSFSLGDTARIIIKDERFSNLTGYTNDKRLTAFTLHPPTSTEVEEAELIFEGDTLGAQI